MNSGKQPSQASDEAEVSHRLMFIAAVLIIAALTFAGARLYEQSKYIDALYAEQDRLNAALTEARSPLVELSSIDSLSTKAEKTPIRDSSTGDDPFPKAPNGSPPVASAREAELQGIIDFLRLELKAANQRVQKLEALTNTAADLTSRERSEFR